jgi:hypothetical protein
MVDMTKVVVSWWARLAAVVAAIVHFLHFGTWAWPGDDATPPHHPVVVAAPPHAAVLANTLISSSGAPGPASGATFDSESGPLEIDGGPQAVSSAAASGGGGSVPQFIVDNRAAVRHAYEPRRRSGHAIILRAPANSEFDSEPAQPPVEPTGSGPVTAAGGQLREETIDDDTGLTDGHAVVTPQLATFDSEPGTDDVVQPIRSVSTSASIRGGNGNASVRSQTIATGGRIIPATAP